MRSTAISSWGPERSNRFAAQGSFPSTGAAESYRTPVARVPLVKNRGALVAAGIALAVLFVRLWLAWGFRAAVLAFVVCFVTIGVVSTVVLRRRARRQI